MSSIDASIPDEVLVLRQGAVLELTLNRPHKLNAITASMARRLLDALDAAESNPDVEAVLLIGSGRSFCAGRDVSEPPDAEILALVQAVASRLVMGRKPVVAALHGWTVGAGLEWALDCDLTVASRSARFKLPEVSLGVFVTGGITALLPRCAGLARARRILLLGEAFDAPDAERWGLVGTLVDDDAAALAEARRQAARLASFDPHVVADFRRTLRALNASRFEEAVSLETAVQTAIDARHGES